jgi:hypothetical protein
VLPTKGSNGEDEFVGHLLKCRYVKRGTKDTNAANAYSAVAARVHLFRTYFPDARDLHKILFLKHLHKILFLKPSKARRL